MGLLYAESEVNHRKKKVQNTQHEDCMREKVLENGKKYPTFGQGKVEYF